MDRCGEHDLPQPCAKCALLCPCGCGNLRPWISAAMWTAVVALADAYKTDRERT